MSANQIHDLVKSGAYIGQPQGQDSFMYCFVYDHAHWLKFYQAMPSARSIGIGVLKGWVWHINAEGHPNIRVSFLDGSFRAIPESHCVLPTPTTKISPVSSYGPRVYGWVFQYLKQYDTVLHQILGKGCRMRITADVACGVGSLPRPTRLLHNVKVVTYWDPRNTCDSHRSILNNPDVEYQWRKGIEFLRFHGMPMAEAQKIWKHLMGFVADVEPLLLKPTLLAGAKVPQMGMGYVHEEDVVWDPRNAVNMTPSPSPPRKKAPAAPTDTRANSAVEKPVSAKSKSSKAQTPVPAKTAEPATSKNNKNKDTASSSAREAVEAAQRARKPSGVKRGAEAVLSVTNKRQRKSSARPREIVDLAALARDDDDADPEWNPSMG